MSRYLAVLLMSMLISICDFFIDEQINDDDDDDDDTRVHGDWRGVRSTALWPPPIRFLDGRRLPPQCAADFSEAECV